MKTRIIQSQAESPRPPAAAGEPSSERPERRNIARAVHRIADHRKAAILVCLAFVTVAVLIGVLSIALARASATVAPRGSASAAAQPAIGWTPCGPRLECANVRVPLNWRKRAGRRSC